MVNIISSMVLWPAAAPAGQPPTGITMSPSTPSIPVPAVAGAQFVHWKLMASVGPSRFINACAVGRWDQGPRT